MAEFATSKAVTDFNHLALPTVDPDTICVP